MIINEVKTTISGYKPTLDERETIITFNETQEPAEVFTYNPALIRKLDGLTDSRPDEVTCCRAEAVNGVQLRTYTIPKKWVKVNPSRILTEEEKTTRAELMKRNRETAKLSEMA